MQDSSQHMLHFKWARHHTWRVSYYALTICCSLPVTTVAMTWSLAPLPRSAGWLSCLFAVVIISKIIFNKCQEYLSGTNMQTPCWGQHEPQLPTAASEPFGNIFHLTLKCSSERRLKAGRPKTNEVH